MKQKLILSALFCVLFFAAKAQKLYPVVCSSLGGYTKNASGSLTYTAGEPLYQTATTSQNILTQGFNQTLIVLTTTDIENEKTLTIPIKLFPNPVESSFQLQVEKDNLKNLTYQVLDLNGKTLVSKPIQVQTQTVDLSKYAASTYLLQITDKSNGKSKTFKVQKIK